MIVGHGNFGAGIGSHTEFYNEKQLLDILVADGLVLIRDEPLWIYIFACWGAVSTTSPLTKYKKSFGSRFAGVLEDAGARNIYIVGFAGSVSSGADVSTDLYYGKKEVNMQKYAGGVTNRYSMWYIGANGAERQIGVDWLAKTTWAPSKDDWKRLHVVVEQALMQASERIEKNKKAIVKAYEVKKAAFLRAWK